MKKLVVIIFFLALQPFVFAQETKKIPNQEVINLGDGMKIIKTYYSPGKYKAIWTYRNNKLDGASKIFYESGEIAFIDTYANGEKINRRAYDSFGKLKFDETYPLIEKTNDQSGLKSANVEASKDWLKDAHSPTELNSDQSVATTEKVETIQTNTSRTSYNKNYPDNHDPEVGDGNFLFDINANFSRFLGSNSGGMSVAVSRFCTDYFLPGIALAFNVAEGVNDFAFGLPLLGVLNQRTRVFPYAGIIPGVYHISLAGESETGFFFGFSAGIGFLIVEHVGITASFEYKRIFIGSGINMFQVPIGLAVYF